MTGTSPASSCRSPYCRCADPALGVLKGVLPLWQKWHTRSVGMVVSKSDRPEPSEGGREESAGSQPPPKRRKLAPIGAAAGGV